MGRGRWTQQAVITAIRRRARAGKSLAQGWAYREDSALVSRARYLFGSWRAAVEAAGYDYDAILAESREHTIRTRRPKYSWDRLQVIMAIRRRWEAGRPLNVKAVFVEEGPLVTAGFRYFGSWEAAIEESLGIPYELVRRYRSWTPELVVKAIQHRHGGGSTLWGRYVQKEVPSLYQAAVTHFGSWKAAIEAAGLEYLGVGTSWKWDRERLLAALHEWAASGERGLPRRLQGPVLRWYGSWEKALAAAGLPSSLATTKALRRTWTREEVLEAIRERHRQGKSLVHTDVRKDDVRLLEAARRLFGRWTVAREEALRSLNGELGASSSVTRSNTAENGTL